MNCILCPFSEECRLWIDHPKDATECGHKEPVRIPITKEDTEV